MAQPGEEQVTEGGSEPLTRPRPGPWGQRGGPVFSPWPLRSLNRHSTGSGQLPRLHRHLCVSGPLGCGQAGAQEGAEEARAGPKPGCGSWTQGKEKRRGPGWGWGSLGAPGALGGRRAALEFIPVPVQSFLLVLCGSDFSVACPGPWEGATAAMPAAGPSGPSPWALSRRPLLSRSSCGRSAGLAASTRPAPRSVFLWSSPTPDLFVSLSLMCLVVPALSQTRGEYIHSLSLVTLRGSGGTERSSNLPAAVQLANGGA